MAPDPVGQLVALLCAGVGMVAAAGVNLLFGRLGFPWRAALTVLACGGVLAGGVGLVGERAPVWLSAAVMAAGVGAGFALGWRPLGGLVRSAALAVTGRPAVRWGLLAGVGLLTAGAAVAVYQIEETAAIDRDMYELGFLDRPPVFDPHDVAAVTDRGTRVVLKQAAAPRDRRTIDEDERQALKGSPLAEHAIRRGPADDATNCHGWVFAGGRYWLPGETVEQIIRENGYAEVTDPRPGDLVVYRGPTGVPAHTAVVRYATPGYPPMVEGKWGWLGVYLHPVDQSIYGAEYKFYRSPRPGHLLAGLGDSAASSAIGN